MVYLCVDLLLVPATLCPFQHDTFLGYAIGVGQVECGCPCEFSSLLQFNSIRIEWLDLPITCCESVYRFDGLTVDGTVQKFWSVF